MKLSPHERWKLRGLLRALDAVSPAKADEKAAKIDKSTRPAAIERDEMEPQPKAAGTEGEGPDNIHERLIAAGFKHLGSTGRHEHNYADEAGNKTTIIDRPGEPPEIRMVGNPGAGGFKIGLPAGD